jgi:hypothetical protein
MERRPRWEKFRRAGNYVQYMRVEKKKGRCRRLGDGRKVMRGRMG